MENIDLSRSHLETLPTAELLALADDFGIDVPENLSRRFVIGELLELADDARRKSGFDLKNSTPGIDSPASLASTYNDTQISVVLKNPAWIFVYWSIREDDAASLSASAGFVSLGLRIAFFPDDREGSKATETFDVSVSLSDCDKYILLPSSGRFLRADLVAEFKADGIRTLAFSRRIPLPDLAGKRLRPEPEMRIPPVLKLSGYDELLRTHYQNHRHSFM